jgi:hypothetical protein
MTLRVRRVHVPQAPDAPEEQEYQASEPIVVDAYQGQGGSYILDSETGVRTLVQRTLPPEMAGQIETQEVTSNATSDTQTPDSGGDGEPVRD